MRRISVFVPCFAVASAIALGPVQAWAQERGSIQGFGGLSLNALETASPSPSLGGTVTVSLLPAVQIVGEAGRLANVLPTLSGTVLSLAGVTAPAFYGEGGARLLLAPSSPVTPYAEATAGVARLQIRSDEFGTIGNAAATLALDIVDRTTPTFGAGAGILLRGGPVLFDVGYRYKQLFADDVIRLALGFGQPLRTHQVRVGFGFRF